MFEKIVEWLNQDLMSKPTKKVWFDSMGEVHTNIPRTGRRYPLSEECLNSEEKF